MNVVIDLDGVVYDFERAFCEKFGWEHRELFKLEERYPDKSVEIELFSTSGRTYRELCVMEDGGKITRFCQNAGHTINIISSRPFYMKELTREALLKDKIPFHKLEVGVMHKIFKIKQLKPLFVVDDMLSVVEECAEVGIPSFLVDHPWNQKADLDGIIYRVKNFNEFLARYTDYFDV